MASVFLGLGSNIRRDYYIRRGVWALREAFGDLRLSSVYESEAVGFTGDPFFNLVVGLTTSLSVDQLFEAIRQIEHDNQRCSHAVKFSPRTLDIDILTYGDYCGVFAGGTLPRAEITKNAFVLWPLAEIAGDTLHPGFQKSFTELWHDFSGPRKLQVVDFDFTDA